VQTGESRGLLRGPVFEYNRKAWTEKVGIWWVWGMKRVGVADEWSVEGASPGENVPGNHLTKQD